MIPRFKRHRKKLFGLLVAALLLGLAAAWLFGSFYSAACNHPVALPKNLAVEPVSFANMRNITTPKLFLAGTEDRETKFAEVKAMFAGAAEPKDLVPFEGAKHEDLLDFAPDKYQQTVLPFLNANLK